MEKFLKHKTTELKPTDEIFLRLLSSKSSIFPPDEEKCREKKLLQESRQLGYEKDFAQAQCKFEAAEKLKLTIALKAKEFTDATKALNTAKRRLSATIDAYEYAKAQSWDEIIVHLEGRLYDYHKAVEEKEKHAKEEKKRITMEKRQRLKRAREEANAEEGSIAEGPVEVAAVTPITGSNSSFTPAPKHAASRKRKVSTYQLKKKSNINRGKGSTMKAAVRSKLTQEKFNVS
jgi:hypothetical protein